MTLRFDFQGQTRCFSNPDNIIQTSRCDEILAKLAEIERAVADGFYAAGYLAYEAASAFQPYYQTPPPGEMPLLWFGLYSQPDTACKDDHTEESTQGVSQWQPLTDAATYRAAIARIKAEIAAGNTYQTNYAIRLQADIVPDGDPDGEAFYRHLRQAQQADYCAYLNLGRFCLLSASPELFFHWQHGVLTTKPMKGTLKRGTSAADDLQQQQALAHSTKDRAENVMIVDLLRNDMSQVAIPGTVNVTSLFNVEQYPTVWQMTSTIQAQTQPETRLTDIFRALFPCGSITGAPKASTMRLIRELETQPREVYCGAIGYITPHNEAVFSVPIRTVIMDKQQQKARYGVGGGITWDSTAENEYQEVIAKAHILQPVALPQHLLESLRLHNGAYHLLEAHLARLAASARYFNVTFNRPQIELALTQLAQIHANGTWKIRLLLAKNGEITLNAEAIAPLTQPLMARWAAVPIQRHNPLLYHKTTLRDGYPPATLTQEFLLYNQEDEITEFVNGNVALLIDGKWLTPPVDCGLLPGTERQALLAAGKIHEAVLPRLRLQHAEKIAFINSVRGWREVEWRSDE